MHVPINLNKSERKAKYSFYREVALFIMRPHTDYFHNPLIMDIIDYTWLFYDLIDKPVLYINSPGISTCKISYQLFIARRNLVWVLSDDIYQLFGFWR